MILGIIIGAVAVGLIVAAGAVAIIALAKMTRLGMLLTFAWLGLRHWLATWLRWIAYLIDGRNTTLGQCECGAIWRPWPVPRSRHTSLCRGA